MQRPVVVVSTHFDDAVLSVARQLLRAGAAATVVTVRGGEPPADVAASDWDVACGFDSGRAAAIARAAEDRAACASTGARAVHLPFPDGPYGDAPEPAVRAAVAALLTPGDALWLPAGIGGHADHHSTRDALRPLVARHCGPVMVYADGAYAGAHGWDASDRDRLPEARWHHARRALRDGGVRLGRRRRWGLDDAELARKRDLVSCHASQVAALEAAFGGLGRDLLATEIAWPARPA